MAVEIIKRGTLPKERPYTAICRKCTTVFKFTEADAFYTYDQREGGFFTLDCPLCKTKVTISSHV